jgi:hypothetical protein
VGIWGWVQAIATGWFVLSILLATAWALGGKRIFRKPPAPKGMEPGDSQVVFLNGHRVTNYEVLDGSSWPGRGGQR